MSASISTTTLSLVITFWRGNTYTVSRRSILSVRKWRANESPAGVTMTWCQSIARGLSMIGMIRLTPEDRVRWYLPSRSMIIVCACCTIRIPRATIEIANSAIATGTISEPMLSISALLVHVQRSPFDPHHHHAAAGLDHRVHERRTAPVLTLHQDPTPAGGGVDPLGHDANPAHERIHVGLDLAPGGVQAPQQEGADPREREQRPRGEAQGGREKPRSEEHTSELQSLAYLVCRLLLEKKKKTTLDAACRE